MKARQEKVIKQIIDHPIYDTRRLIPLQEAASQLSMCRQTIMQHVRAGRLKCVRVASNAVYFRPAQLEDFIDSHVEGFSPARVPKG